MQLAFWALRGLNVLSAQATPTITWDNPADIVYGTALGATQLNATADVAGTMTYTPPAGTVLNAGLAQNLHVDFVPDDTVNYTNANKDVAINVLQAMPVITWDNPADIVYGTALDNTQLNAAADVPGTMTYTPAAGTVLNAGNGQALHVDFVPEDTVNYANASKDVTINVAGVQITRRETQDTDGNGRIDAIRMETNAPLNDNFDGVVITVVDARAGYIYTVKRYDSGATSNDNEFFVRLDEGPAPDTGATPDVQVLDGGSLGLAVDAAGVQATDKAKPVLMAALWVEGSAGGVAPGEAIQLTCSEPVTSNNAQASDFGLPVQNDRFGVGSTVSAGQNPNMLTITLQGDPLLSPGGLYDSWMLAAGSPSGVFVDIGANIVDNAQNTALNQSIPTAVDLQPGDEKISICWADDLSIAPKNWDIGLSDGGATYQAFDYFQLRGLPNGLVARNNGNVWEKFTVNCSTSYPDAWTVAADAGSGPDRFEQKADNSGPPYTVFPLDLSAGPQDLATQLYSGHNQAFDLRFRLPTSVTVGSGIGQTIFAIITATKD